MNVKIKVEKFLMRQGIRVGKAAIEFTGEGPLNGFHLVGFTICDDVQKGMFVMFPMAKTNPGSTGPNAREGQQSRNFFFLRPDKPELLDDLSEAILDVYESLENDEFKNRPRIKQSEVPVDVG
jgi:hypothetical protein